MTTDNSDFTDEKIAGSDLGFSCVSVAVRGQHQIEDLIASSSRDAFEGDSDWNIPEGKEVW